jgi:hypothetical protein
MVPSLSPLLEELVAVKSVQAALSSRTSIETVQSWMMVSLQDRGKCSRPSLDVFLESAS